MINETIKDISNSGSFSKEEKENLTLFFDTMKKAGVSPIICTLQDYVDRANREKKQSNEAGQSI